MFRVDFFLSIPWKSKVRWENACTFIKNLIVQRKSHGLRRQMLVGLEPTVSDPRSNCYPLTKYLSYRALTKTAQLENCKVCISLVWWNTYRIVASTNTCYYSGNQIFWFLKSRIVTCHKMQFFLGKKTFLFFVKMSWEKRYLTNTLCVCQVAGISKRSDNIYFLTPYVTNWISLN